MKLQAEDHGVKLKKLQVEDHEMELTKLKVPNTTFSSSLPF